MERGREQPPGFIATAAPRPSRRVAHAPVSVSRSLAECRATCAPFARALSRAYTLQITRGSHCTFNTHLRKYSRSFGHHIVSVELCSVLREELTLAQIDHHTEAVDELDVQGILAFAERILPRASDLWVQASLDYKQRLQQLFFPEGIAFDGNRFNRTAATAPLFNYLAPSESADEKMVSLIGIEPQSLCSIISDAYRGACYFTRRSSVRRSASPMLTGTDPMSAWERNSGSNCWPGSTPPTAARR